NEHRQIDRSSSCRSYTPLTRIGRSTETLAAGPIPPQPPRRRRNGTPTKGRWGVERLRSRAKRFSVSESQPPADGTDRSIDKKNDGGLRLKPRNYVPPDLKPPAFVARFNARM